MISFRKKEIAISLGSLMKKRWRNEYLVELRNAYRYLGHNDTSRGVFIGDTVIVHEDQPRGKWRTGKILDLISGSDGCIREAVVQVRSK